MQLHQCIYALKFLYENILNTTWDVNKLPRLKKDKKLPVILSKSEVENLFSVIYKEESWQEIYLRITGEDIRICPECGQGKMVTKETIRYIRPSPA